MADSAVRIDLRNLHESGVLIVGAGRMGTALAAALSEAADRHEIAEVHGPVGRPEGVLHGADSESSTDFVSGTDADIVLLAVPDAAIAEAARDVAPGGLVGHLSGATTLEPLAPHEAFSLHPLTSVTGATSRFTGASAAIAGTTERARGVAGALATLLGMTPFEVADHDRAAYHATASIAANFLVTVEGFAEDLGKRIGLDRAVLVPLVRAAVEHWANDGAARALTGPIARGDDETVARQREAVETLMPEYGPLFDALTTATRELAARQPATSDLTSGSPSDENQQRISTSPADHLRSESPT